MEVVDYEDEIPQN